MNWTQMNAISAAGALTLAMLATSVAQTAPAPAQNTNQTPSATAPGTPAKGMAKAHRKARRDEFAKLNLTDEQKAQMKSIGEKAFQEKKAIMSDTTTTDAQKKAKLRSLFRDTRKQRMAVLTPEQRQQLKQAWQERHQAKQKAQQPS